jgi:hypothetical protein
MLCNRYLDFLTRVSGNVRELLTFANPDRNNTYSLIAAIQLFIFRRKSYVNSSGTISGERDETRLPYLG